MTASRVPHNSADRAATPFDNLGSTISSTRLTNSPFLVAHTLEQPHIIDTSTITSASTQSEIHAQLALEQWNFGGYESDPIPVPNHWPLHDSSSSTAAISYSDTGSYLANGDPEHSEALYYGLAAQFTPSSGADYFMQHTNEATDLATGVKPTGNLACTPILPAEMTTDCILLGFPGFSLDVLTQSTADSQIQSHLVGPTPLPWALDDFNPWLPLIDHTLAEPAASSSSPSNTTKSPREGKPTKSVSKYCNLCPPGKGRLACLFSKYDPKVHATCLSKHFDSIGHLKQHLVQSHKLGTHHCTSCWRTFETPEILASHGDCVPTGGKSVDKLPVFPKTRISPDKKWHWCRRQLFGEATALPECPFYHPWDDIAAYIHARSPKLSQVGYVGRGCELNNASLSSSDREHTPLSSLPDQQPLDDKTYPSIRESGLFGLIGEDFHTASSDICTNVSPTTHSWNFEIDDI